MHHQNIKVNRARLAFFLRAPTCSLQHGLADAPAGGQLLLVEMNDFDLGLLPNELAGVMKELFRPRAKRYRRAEGYLPDAGANRAIHTGAMLYFAP